jgi:phosphatidylserine/phosphatidylglycerophosphate/cardiolipin synthase-like enzyme
MKPKLLHYDQFLPELMTALQRAKRSITISVMVAYVDAVTEPYFEEILAALRRGVKVKIYLDRYSRTWRSENVIKYIKYGIKNRTYLKKMQDLGAEVVWLGRVGLNPFHGRIHQKVYLIDKTAYIGGINFAFEQPKNDLMVKIVDDKLVRRVGAWLRQLQTGRDISHCRYQVDQQTTVIFDPAGQDLIYSQLCRLAKAAREVKISSRMCPSGPVMDILATKNTKYFFNPMRNMAPTTQLAIWLDRRHYHIKNSYGGRKYLHAKCALFDNQKVIVGSENFNYRGIKWRATEMAIVTSQPSVVTSVERFFHSL